MPDTKPLEHIPEITNDPTVKYLIKHINKMSDVINSQSDAIFKMFRWVSILRQTQFKMLQTQENHNQTIAHLVAYSQKGKKLAE